MQTVLIDGITTLYGAFVEYGLDDGPRTVEYGFLEKILDLQESFSDAQFVVLWGNLFHPDRKDFFEQYGRRGANFQAFGLNDIRQSLQTSLPTFGVDQYTTDRGEVYDLFVSAQDNWTEPMLVYSADRRFLCFVDTTTVVKIAEDRLYDPDVVSQVFNVTPPEMKTYLSLLGDQTIGIPGVDLHRQHVGRLVEESDDPEEIFEAEGSSLLHDEQVTLSAFYPQFKLNQRLIEPIDVTYETQEGEYDEDTMEEYIETFPGLELQDLKSNNGFMKYN